MISYYLNDLNLLHQNKRKQQPLQMQICNCCDKNLNELPTFTCFKTLFKHTVFPVPGGPETYKLPDVLPAICFFMNFEIIDVSFSLQSILSGTDACNCCLINPYCFPVIEITVKQLAFKA